MAVVEADADGVVTDRLDRDDRHVGLAGNQGLVAGVVTLHLGRRALDPQQFGRNRESGPALENDRQGAAVAGDTDVGRPDGTLPGLAFPDRTYVTVGSVAAPGLAPGCSSSERASSPSMTPEARRVGKEDVST